MRYHLVCVFWLLVAHNNQSGTAVSLGEATNSRETNMSNTAPGFTGATGAASWSGYPFPIAIP